MTPSPQKLPQWLSTAVESKSYLPSGLRTLSLRESYRVAARQVYGRDTPNVDPEYLLLVKHYSIAAGGEERHRLKNRYADIIPYDRTGVVVDHGSNHEISTNKKPPHSRYLNANWVLERSGHKWWIAAQAPLRHTAHAFLSMMLQPSVQPPNTTHSGPSPTRTYRIRTAVQLTQNVESGRRKADVYFPTEVGQSSIVPPEEGCNAPALKVTLLKRTTIEEAHCVHSTVSVTALRKASATTTSSTNKDGNYPNEDEFIFQHLLYLSWPDHGVPDPKDRKSFLAFINLVDKTNRDKSHCQVHTNPTPDHPCMELDPDPPILIGCSAGVGRTGSFIAISSLLRKYGFLPPASRPTMPSAIPPSPLGPLPDNLKDDLIMQEIDSLREQRPGMVQRNEQAVLVYDVLINMFNKGDSSR